jgi:glucose-6-phosphate isomerase
MLEFSFENTSGMTTEGVMPVANRLSPYIEQLKNSPKAAGYDTASAFMDLPRDTEMFEEVRAMSRELGPKNLRYAVVVGIGGSSQGAKAVYEALQYQDASKEKKEESGSVAEAELFFAETVDGGNTKAILDRLSECESPDEFAIVVVSKSGNTTETVANASVLYSTLTKQHGDISSRVVCVTNKGTKLWMLAEDQGFKKLAIPENVGGRYSVFSPVGLLPLALAGIDIKGLLEGAKDMRERALSEDLSQNPSALSAGIAFYHYQSGVEINNLFLFEPTLSAVGAWWRQLLAESLGKEYDRNGREVNTGILPVVSVGSQDLHSVVQLYLGGPNNMFSTFVSVKEHPEEFTVPRVGVFSELITKIDGNTYTDIMNAIMKGVETAYERRALPFAGIELSKLGEYELGELLQMKMMEVVYLGKMVDVNIFDQPNVEEYKSETRKLLGM